MGHAYFVYLCGMNGKCVRTRAGNTERNSVFRYFSTTGGTFRYRNTEYDIGTDTEWMIPNDFFGIFGFPAPTKNLHNIYSYVR